MKPILINLDLKDNNYSEIELKQGCQDTLIATITDLGDVVDLVGQVISIEMLKADNTFIIQSTDITVLNNKVTVILNKDLTRVSGKGKMQIKMTENNIVSGSWVVDVRIKKGAIDNAIGESGNIVTIKEELDKSIVQATEENKKTQDLIQNGGAATKGDVATINSQLADIVTELNWINPDDFDGTDYEKLQKSIDLVVNSGTEKVEIKLSRVYTLNNLETLMINRDNKNGGVLIIKGISGGIHKNGGGYMFSSQDKPQGANLEEHWTGDIRIQSLHITGNEDENTIIFDGDKLIRCYMYDCDVNHVSSIVKSTTYTQSYYILRNKIRYGNGVLLDTANNYDLNFSDNLFEWGRDFFKFSSANGCRITNNLVEGIRGYTVKANGGCQSLSFENNYFEFNKEYFDFTNLKGYGLNVSNNYCHDTDVNKVFCYLPTKAFGSSTFQDIYHFKNNVSNGGSKGFAFKETPSSLIKIISDGDMIGSTSAVDSNFIVFKNSIYTVAKNANGTKKTVKGDSITLFNDATTVYINHSTNNPKTKIVDINIGYPVNITDSINVYCNGGGDDITNNSIAPINIMNVYPAGSKIKVVYQGNDFYQGDIGINFKVLIVKNPTTNWF